MLVLPIINRNRIMNVEVTLKDAIKTHSSVILDNISESDVVVNQRNFLNSSYVDDGNVVDFIRNTSIINPRDFLVTTREEANSNRYDVYSVKQPPKFVNPVLDNLYASVITDMRKEIPNARRGHYLSFAKLGMDKYLTDEKVARLQEVIRDTRDHQELPRKLQEAGILDLKLTLEFFNHFDWKIISDTTLPEDSIENTLKALEPLNTRDYHNLKKYYDMAKSNKEIYSKLSLINRSLYNEPYRLITSSKVKNHDMGLQKVKLPNEVYNEGVVYGNSI